MMTGRKRAGALLLCIGLVFVLSVSIAFVMHEAGHDCTGEDCGICAQLEAVVSGFVFTGSAAAAVACVFLLHPRTERIGTPKRAACAFTPMRSKVRLNN